MEKRKETASSKDADTRDQILAAAKRVFAQHGFEGATIKLIVEAAQVNAALVSYYFDGKEGLYRACFEQLGKSRLASSERLLAAPKTQEDLRVRIQLFVEEFFAWHLEEPDVTSIMHRECGGTMPLTRDIFRATFIKSFEVLVGFFESAKKSGLLRKDVNAFLTASLFFGGLVHLVRFQQVAKEEFSFSLLDAKPRALVIDTAVKNLLGGILA